MVLSKGFVFMIALNVRNSWIAVALAKGLARQKTRAGESDLGIDGRSRRGPEGDFGGSPPRAGPESRLTHLLVARFSVTQRCHQWVVRGGGIKKCQVSSSRSTQNETFSESFLVWGDWVIPGARAIEAF